jgi:hypothetical protein
VEATLDSTKNQALEIGTTKPLNTFFVINFTQVFEIHIYATAFCGSHDMLLEMISVCNRRHVSRSWDVGSRFSGPDDLLRPNFRTQVATT